MWKWSLEHPWHCMQKCIRRTLVSILVHQGIWLSPRYLTGKNRSNRCFSGRNLGTALPSPLFYLSDHYQFFSIRPVSKIAWGLDKKIGAKLCCILLFSARLSTTSQNKITFCSVFCRALKRDRHKTTIISLAMTTAYDHKKLFYAPYCIV